MFRNAPKTHEGGADNSFAERSEPHAVRPPPSHHHTASPNLPRRDSPPLSPAILFRASRMHPLPRVHQPQPEPFQVAAITSFTFPIHHAVAFPEEAPDRDRAAAQSLLYPRRSPKLDHLCSDRVAQPRHRTLARKPQMGKALSSPAPLGRWLEIGPLRYKVSGASSGRGAGQYFAGHFPRISVT